MLVVITGGGGFLGRTLAQQLLVRGELTGPSGQPEKIDRIVLADIAFPPAVPDDPRVERVVGDVADAAFVAGLIGQDDVAVFHLASMVSAGCEADFDGALRVNLGSTQAVLEAVRARAGAPRVVFTSSVAAFGGEAVAGICSDRSKLTPETTYGMTKVIGELLVNDYTRKGFIDGRSARLPTVIIRPGRPNAAASSWVSGIFREPLNGETAVVPIALSTRVPVSGYRTLVDNLIRLHEADGAVMGPDRGFNLPAIVVTGEEMVAALERTGRTLGPIEVRPDPLVERIFAGWAAETSFERASALGLVTDDTLDPIIAAYIEDFLTP
jgi:nucleoside-diphosphate-sugar epimerase